MSYQHKQLASGRWYKLTFFEQLANIGSEVERAICWRDKNKQYSIKAIERALELLELTISDIKNCFWARLKELTRLYEILVDFFYFDNQFSSSDKLFRDYFYNFNYAAARERKKGKRNGF